MGMFPAHRAYQKLDRLIKNMPKLLNQHCQTYVYLSNNKTFYIFRIHITITCKPHMQKSHPCSSKNDERVVFLENTPRTVFRNASSSNRYQKFGRKRMSGSRRGSRTRRASRDEAKRTCKTERTPDALASFDNASP